MAGGPRGQAAGLVREGRSRAFEAHAGEAVQAHDLDHGPDLWLRVAKLQGAALNAQTSCQHRQVHHQRRVGKREFPQIDGNVALRPDRPGERPAPISLRRPVFVASTAENR